MLRMIEEFMQALNRIRGLKQGQDWRTAGAELEKEFQRLIGGGPQAVAALSETELMARLIQGESTHLVHDRALMLASLLKEAGDVATEEDRAEDARSCYLKGLRLLLQTLARQEVYECPEFVPKVEMFVLALQDVPLPLETQALLMQYYERTGEFARAEDALFAMLEMEPENQGIVEFGITFYERIWHQRDANLIEGDLPRSELESGMAELRKRREKRVL